MFGPTQVPKRIFRFEPLIVKPGASSASMSSNQLSDVTLARTVSFTGVGYSVVYLSEQRSRL